MNISLIFDFRKKAPKPQDVGTVSIRLYDNKRQQILSTGVRCRRCEWSAKRWVIGREDAAELNAKIKAAYDEAVASAGGPVHSLRTGGAPFLDWMAQELKHMQASDTTVYRHQLLLRELEAYGKIKTFRDVNAKKIMQLLRDKAAVGVEVVVDGKVVRQPLSQTTIYTFYRRFVRWVHLAMAQDLVAQNALAGVKVSRGEFKQREHLTKEEMERWLQASPPYAHLVKARDLFAVQAGTGLAYVDLMSVDFSRMEKSGEFWTLTGVRHKTGKPYFIVVLPWAKEVIDRYGGKLPHMSNARYNGYLKEVAAYAHIYKKISSHDGRHTYACLCLSAGVRIEAVQRTLGHTDIKTTQIYAKLVDQDVLAAFRAAYSE